MNKTVLHLGLHKTGTTFLQRNIFPNLRNYKLITRPYTQHNYAFNKMQYADDSLFSYKEIKEEIREFSNNNLIISDESFSGKPIMFSHINRSQIAKRLSTLFPDAIAILFIRNQSDILFSLYNQYVKMGGVHTINEFLWTPSRNYSYSNYIHETLMDKYTFPMNTLFYNTNEWNVNIDIYNYYELITMYRTYFKRMEIFLYEDLLNNSSHVKARLENIFEEQLDDALFVNNEKVNKSIRNTSLVRLVNNFNCLLGKNLSSICRKVASSISIPEDYEKIDVKLKQYFKENNKLLYSKYNHLIGLDDYSKDYGISELLESDRILKP